MNEEAGKHKAFDLYDLECKGIGELLSYLCEWEMKKENGDLYLSGKLNVFASSGDTIGTIIDDENGTFRYRPATYCSEGDSCSDSND